MRTKIFTLLTVLFCFALSSTNAQTRTHERQRIRQGVKSGDLTTRETRTLARQQKDIHQDKKEARADGKVTRSERKHIKRDEHKASRNIYRKKHNARDRK